MCASLFIHTNSQQQMKLGKLATETELGHSIRPDVLEACSTKVKVKVTRSAVSKSRLFWSDYISNAMATAL